MIDELSLGLAPGGRRPAAAASSTTCGDGAPRVADRRAVRERGARGGRPGRVPREGRGALHAGPPADLLDRPDLLRSVFLRRRPVGDGRGPPRGAAGRTAPAGRRPPTTAAREPPSAPCCGAVDSTPRSAACAPSTTCRSRCAPGEIVGHHRPQRRRQDDPVRPAQRLPAARRRRVHLAGRDITGAAGRGPGRPGSAARSRTPACSRPSPSTRPSPWPASGGSRSATRSRPRFHLPTPYDSERAVAAGGRAGRAARPRPLPLAVHPRAVDRHPARRRPGLPARPRARGRPARRAGGGIAQREVEALAPLIRRIRDETGASLVVIEHDMPLVRAVADRVVAMDQGGCWPTARRLGAVRTRGGGRVPRATDAPRAVGCDRRRAGTVSGGATRRSSESESRPEPETEPKPRLPSQPEPDRHLLRRYGPIGAVRWWSSPRWWGCRSSATTSRPRRVRQHGPDGHGRG